jgi:hypothetical protein
MLAACVEDGLTVGRTVLTKGDIFVLGDEVLGDGENVSDERMARKQIRMYGKVQYRKATPEEIINAVLHSKKISTKDLTTSEKALVSRYAQGRKAKEAEARSYLIEEEGKLAKEDEFLDEVVDEAESEPVEEVPQEDEEDETKELPAPVASKKMATTRKPSTSRKKPK